MMNLFENLQAMNEITTKQETMDDYFDKLINEIQNKYNCDIDDTYYDIDNYPSEFKARFVIYNIGLKQTDDIEKLIIKEISKDYNDVKVDYEFDNNYLDDFIKTAYVFEIRANNDINLWDTYNEELKLNENEELKESDDVNNNSIEKYILDTNNVWNKIKEIKNEYDEAINSIWDLNRNHNWLFSVKLYDAITADNAEQDFEIYAEDTWNSWVDDVEDITGMNYDEVMQADNHNQSYFKFRDSFSILCNDSIDFSNFATLIETLSDENIIGNYYDANFETFIIDNKIDIDKFNEEFSDYDDKGLDYIRYLYNELNDYVLSDLNIEIKQIKEIIHVYNSIKENQIKDIETYVNM